MWFHLNFLTYLKSEICLEPISINDVSKKNLSKINVPFFKEEFRKLYLIRQIYQISNLWNPSKTHLFTKWCILIFDLLVTQQENIT